MLRQHGGSLRLIPAHAGKTARVPVAMTASPAHPRSRGENSDITVTAVAATGSSPLTRGKPEEPHRAVRDRGLIPAHAGKTRPWTLTLTRPRAHPRSRGENSWIVETVAALAGSSPLTRGKLDGERRRSRSRGLIPAHAGKTCHDRARFVCAQAHPRSRGENDHELLRAHPVGGSSPLTRGKQPPAPAPAGVQRLIPAHAGKTAAPSALPIGYQAHPRSRGENANLTVRHHPTEGSSPLTRGKLSCLSRSPGRTRLIPAHAGKTVTRV